MVKLNISEASRTRKWRMENPEKYLRGNRERSWAAQGIDVAQATLLREACKKCELCGSTHRLCIDHCHISKVIRGVLCDRCNRGLGFFDEDSLRLRNAANYLDKLGGIE